MAKKEGFGEAFKELEDIVSWFEKEDADIEEGIKKFERGMELAKACKDRLRHIENKVVEIRKKFGEQDTLI